MGAEDRTGLMLIFGAMGGKELVDVAASLEIICRMYVGWSPGSVKSLDTISPNSKCFSQVVDVV